MDFTKYTKRQQQIIDGKLSLNDVLEIEIRRIYAKALYTFDVKTLEFAEKELKRRDIDVPSRVPFSERQLAMINNREVLEDASEGDLTSLCVKSERLGDRRIGELVMAEFRRRGSAWVRGIQGYNTNQVLIIEGEKDIAKVHDNALRGLRKAAIKCGDLDIIAWTEDEIARRGLPPGFKENQLMTRLYSLAEDGPYDKMTESELNYTLYYISKTGMLDRAPLLLKEIRARCRRSRDLEYTKEEKDIIKGRIPLSEADLLPLNDLYKKISVDNSCDPAFISMVKAEIDCRLDSLKKKKWEQLTRYTERQQLILEKIIPLYEVSMAELKVILNKAAQRNEGTDVSFIQEEFDARAELQDDDSGFTDIEKMIINSLNRSGLKEKVRPRSPKAFVDAGDTEDAGEKTKPLREIVRKHRDAEYYDNLSEYTQKRPYTKRQEDIINGFIHLNSVSRSEISSILKKAAKIGDEATVELMKGFLVRKDASVRGDHARAIARGEIPYEEIKPRQLRVISKKALEQGNIELYELAQTLIMEKEADAYGRGRSSDPFGRKANARSYNLPYSVNAKSTDYAMDILESRIDPIGLTIMDLQDIRLYADTLPDPAYGKVARMLIREKEDRRSVLTVQTREEACAAIEMNTWYPIRWPEMWFVE